MNTMSKQSLSDYRENYSAGQLEEADVPDDPFKLFSDWLDTARECEHIIEPTAMSVSTVDTHGKPSSRMVLLKHIDDGMVFYTNYDSRKGQQLAANHYAALLFYWPPLERQVRIEGPIEKISQAMSSDYFHSRPRASQLGAVVSPQSQIVQNGRLSAEFAKLEQAYEGQTIPKPDNWGGYRLIPEQFEFWQGRRSRLHDRLTYTPIDTDTDTKRWAINRLAP